MLDDRGAKKAAKREQNRLRKQKERGGLKRKTVADSDDNELDEDERPITHQKELRRVQNKRYHEKKKGNQGGGGGGGGGGGQR